MRPLRPLLLLASALVAPTAMAPAIMAGAALVAPALVGSALIGTALVGTALAQPVDMTGGGPVEVTSTNGIEWRQDEQVVIATGNARAVRDGVTLQAARLIARYRNKAGAAPAAQGTAAQGTPALATAAPGAAQPAADGSAATPLSGGEIWRMEAEGNVHIDTATDHAQGDRAVYDMDQAVMVLTGRNLKLVTADNTITARDSLEYWPRRRMAVARGAASALTTDNRRIAGDTLVGYFLEQAPTPQPPARPAAARPGQPAPAQRNVPGEGSKLDRVEVFGNVEIRTEQEVVRGDRGIYSPVTGTARLLGNVRITRGQNQLNGAEAIVDMRSGIARLVSAPGTRVQGLVVPGSNQPAGGTAATPAPTNRGGAPAR